jgi:hypothetical protein
VIRASLVITVTDHFDGVQQIPTLTAGVHVWNNDVHIAEMDMVLNQLADPYTAFPDSCLEQWAARMGRQAARMLEDNFMQHAHDGDFSYANNFEMVTQVTSDGQ